MTITKAAILEALPTLTEKQRDILTRYYGLGDELPESCKDIADSYEVTVQRISKIRTDCEQKILAALVDA